MQSIGFELSCEKSTRIRFGRRNEHSLGLVSNHLSVHTMLFSKNFQTIRSFTFSSLPINVFLLHSIQIELRSQ